VVEEGERGSKNQTLEGEEVKRSSVGKTRGGTKGRFSGHPVIHRKEKPREIFTNLGS